MIKTLLLDTNISSFPIYEYLISLGHQVYVVGGNENDFLAKKYQLNYINLNYSNIPELKKIISKLDINFIVPGCNDVSYLSAAEINSNFYGLDSLQTSELLNNKEEFRNFALNNNISVPKTFKKNQVKNNLPVIIKPVDAYSGRGVTILKKYNLKELNKAISKAILFSKSKKYLIEEFIEGQLFSHSAFIENGYIIKEFIVEEHCIASEFAVDTSYVVDKYSRFRQVIKQEIEKICKKLKLVDGLFHTQFIQTKDNIKLIEVTRRCPGDLYSLLIKKATNFNYIENYVNPFINKSFNLNLKNKNKYIIRHTISQSNSGIFTGLNFNKIINIDFFIPLSQSGDIIKQSPFSRIGLLFMKFKSKKELNKNLKNTINRTLYNII